MLNDVKFILPEVILVLSVFYLIVLSIWKKNPRRDTWVLSALAGGIAAFLSLLYLDFYFLESGQQIQIFYFSMDVDGMSMFFRYLSLSLFLLIVLYSQNSKEMDDYLFAEYLILLLGLTVSINFLAMSADLVMLFLSLEAVSLISYLLTGMIAKKQTANEAALKYVLFGAMSSAVMLLGLSWLYGMTHSTRLEEIFAILETLEVAPIVWQYAFVLVFAGFAFKTALVPFHFWTPDVYQGAPFPIATFFSVGPKAAGFAVMLRFFYSYLLESSFSLPALDFLLPIFVVAAVLSMTLGNLTALKQKNIKRMLAYSSIAHAGYIMVGFVAFSTYGNRAVLFSLLVYLVMNAGAFMVAGAINQKFGFEKIEDYRGLAWRGKTPLILAVVLAVFLFSLAGLPPFAGFIGKWYLFAAAIEQGFFGLVIVAVINSVISFYFYARVVKEMFLVNADGMAKLAEDDTEKKDFAFLKIVFPSMAILTFILGLFFSPVFEWIHRLIP